jgi:sulfate transport system permease protein
MGEFGAVSVVSGHIRGITTTVPLQVEMLYNEYRFTAAFSLASLLMCIAIITIVIKTIIEEKKKKSNSINKKDTDNDKD